MRVCREEEETRSLVLQTSVSSNLRLEQSGKEGCEGLWALGEVYSSLQLEKKECYQILTMKLTTALCTVGSTLHVCEWLEVNCPYRNKHKDDRLLEPVGHFD